MERYLSLLGLLVLPGIAWVLSENRKKINHRLVISGIVLQLLMGVLFFETGPGLALFEGARFLFGGLIRCSDEGARFVFGKIEDHHFAFSVLPPIIFYSALTAILFYWGVLQKVIQGMAWLMARVMRASGSESLCSAANIFVGMTVAPLVIRPYLGSMTRSEIMAMMTGGMATAAGGTMAAYVGMGIDAGHIMVASLMSAPAALVIAKIMVPETERSVTMDTIRIKVERVDENVLDAACRGAAEGLKLVLNIAAMLLAFIALIHLVNWALSPEWFYVDGTPLTLERITGWIFAPLAWLIGVPAHEATTVGRLLGEKTIFNEFIAYAHLVEMQEQLSPRSVVITTYALCGFANFGSIAIMIGGVGGLVPSRRADLARFGIRSLIGGTLAALMTASIAGILWR